MPVNQGQDNPVLTATPSPIPPLIENLREFFASKEIDVFLVGGAVRDALVGRTTKDIDVTVGADVQVVGPELASVLNGRFVPLDPAGETVRIVVRRDTEESLVDLSAMPRGIEEDLARRDFTLDALAVPLHRAAPRMAWHRHVIDPHGGLNDLDAGVVRALSPEVFRRDPVRLLRAPRLAVQLGLRIEDNTVHQIRQDAHLVSTIAGERLRDEFLKLLAEPTATVSLRLLDELGLLTQVVPELNEARGVTQPKEHYWDVFGHLIEMASQVEKVLTGPPEENGYVVESIPRFASFGEHFAEKVTDGHSRATLLKLAGLLHDIAKPATKTVETSGRIRFLGHNVQGAEMAGIVLQRLRLSGRGTELVRLMLEHHLRPSQMAQKGELPTGRAIYRYYRDLEDAAIDTLYLNMADYLAARGPMLGREEWYNHCRVIGHILNEGLREKAPEALPKLISGHDIIKAFSVSPGPEVGELLNVVREAQAGGEISTKEEALELVKNRLYSGGGGA